jgi:hypothetical protein
MVVQGDVLYAINTLWVSFGGASHVKAIKYCPLVDDTEVYQNHQITQKQREKEQKKIENKNT